MTIPDFLKSSELIAALLGSAFTLFVTGFGTIVAAIVNRKKRHYTGLVKLEYELQNMLGVLDDNHYILPFFISALKTGKVYWSTLRYLELDPSIDYELFDLTLLNKLLCFKQSLRKLNNDIENISGAYEELKSHFMEKNITQPDYLLNGQSLAKDLESIQNFSKDLVLMELKELLALTRIMELRDQPIINRLYKLLIKTSGGKITEEEISAELIVVEAEIEEVSKKSQQKLDEIKDDNEPAK
ncbi:MAG TPA: hypothetical protein VLE93_01365 [Candidatus Saccharimonadales bacterium]|nr:hypothetical protein [Candidatus Saccharimonadales bacterium]